MSSPAVLPLADPAAVERQFEMLASFAGQAPEWAAAVEASASAASAEAPDDAVLWAPGASPGFRPPSIAGPGPAATTCTVRMIADEVELRSSRAAGIAGTAAGCALVVCAGEVKLTANSLEYTT